jgi:hypothetical protein
MAGLLFLQALSEILKSLSLLTAESSDAS